MKKKFLTLVAVAMSMTLYCNAQVTDISGMKNVIYLANATGAPGEQATLSLQMNNAVTARGFQCDIYLPAGISFALDGDDMPIAELSTARTTSTKTDYFSSAIQSDGALRILCNSTKGYDFDGTTGEIATVLVNIAPETSLNTYSMYVKGGIISDPSAIDHNTENVESSFKVELPVFDDGYAVWIEPFGITEDREDIAIMMANGVDAVSVEFDMELPSEYVDIDGAFNVALGSSTPSTKKYSASAVDNGDGSIHVSCIRKSTNVIPADCGNVLNLCLWFEDGDENPVITDGVQTISLKNIEIVDEYDKVHKATPYTTSFFVGDVSSLETVPVLYGNFGEDGIDALNTAFAANTSVCVYDLTNASFVLSTGEVEVGNKNALILLAEGMSLANDCNVVIDGACSNLKLTDGFAFNAPETFTAASASYNRSFSNNWQTVCLPFNFTLPAGVTAEQLSAVDLDEMVFTFSTVSVLSANTPYIIKNGSSTAALFNGISSASVAKTPAAMEETVASGTDDAVFTGVYESVVSTALTSSNDILFFGNDGNFYYANSSTASSAEFLPFRCYITVPAGTTTAGMKAVIYHSDGTTSVCKIKDAKEIIDAFDLSGRQVDIMQPGSIYILNGKKVLE